MPNIKEFYMGIDGECTFEYDNDEIKKLKLSDVSTSGAVFVPAMPTTEAIIAAAQAARDAGGGFVDLSNMDVTLTQTLPLYDGVIYRGGGAISYTIFGSDVVSGSTVLRGNGAFPAFSHNTVDRASAYNVSSNDTLSNAAFHASECDGAGVQQMALIGFSDGIRAGALYEGGLTHMQISNLVIANSTGWGLWLENCQQGYVRDITVFDAAAGHGAFIASAGNTPGGGEMWNHGNYVVENIFGQTSEAGDVHTVGWVFRTRGVGQHNLNDVHVHGIQSNLVKSGRGYTGTGAATFSGGVLTVTDISKFREESQIYFTTAPSGGSNIKANVSYVVATATPTTGGAGTLTLTDKPGGSVISLAGLTGTLTVVNKGMPGLYVCGVVTYSSWTGVDMECYATNSVYMAGSVGSKIDLQIVTAQPLSNSAFTCRGLPVGNTVNAHQIYNAVDIEDGAVIGWNGPRPTVNNSGTNRGVGIQFCAADTADEHASTANTGRVEMGGGRYIGGSGQSGASWFSLFAMRQMTLTGTSAGQGGNWQQAISYSGSANGTLSLVTLNDGFRGCQFVFSNASASTWTLNTQGGQTIDGAAGVTSVVIPANTTTVLMGMKTAGATYYWARLS